MTTKRRMEILTSTPRGPIRFRDIKLSTRLANSSGTSSCENVRIQGYSFIKEQ